MDSGIPPPRRKACEGCRVAKRRCDLRLPTCSRCSKRNLSCFYPGLPSPELIPEMLSIMNGEYSGGASQSCVGYNTPSMLDSEQRIGFADSQPQAPPPQEPELGLITSLRKSFTMPAPEVAARMWYAIDRLRDVPRMLVMENQTPWSHPRLYADGMPQVMQDAYACCAMYIAKNPINAPIISSLIESRLQQLLLTQQQQDQAPALPRDILAQNQALILYQIMRLFDPNLNTNPALDDAILAALESFAVSLFATTHFPFSPSSGDEERSQLSFPSGTTLDSVMHFWTLWIFEESARRTILATFFFNQIFKLLRGDRGLKCDGKLGLIHSWYLSAHLWKASSAFEFAVAWAEQQHFVIHNVNFTKALQEAHPSDFDSFGTMLLVSIVGFDQAKTWFGSRGVFL